MPTPGRRVPAFPGMPNRGLHVDDEEILAALKGAGREITSVDLAIEIGTITPDALTHRLHALAEKRLIARRQVPGGHSQTWLWRRTLREILADHPA